MDTKPTKPVPVFDIVTIALEDAGDERLLDALRQQEMEIFQGCSQLIIIDLSQYTVHTATPRHIQVAASWIALQDRRLNGQCPDVALVVDKELVQCAWRLVAKQACIGKEIAIFSSVSLAYQWASERLNKNEDGVESKPDERRSEPIYSTAQ